MTELTNKGIKIENSTISKNLIDSYINPTQTSDEVIEEYTNNGVISLKGFVTYFNKNYPINNDSFIDYEKINFYIFFNSDGQYVQSVQQVKTEIDNKTYTFNKEEFDKTN